MIEVNVSGDAEIDLLEGIEYYESKEEGLGLFFRHSVLADLTSTLQNFSILDLLQNGI